MTIVSFVKTFDTGAFEGSSRVGIANIGIAITCCCWSETVAETMAADETADPSVAGEGDTGRAASATEIPVNIAKR